MKSGPKIKPDRQCRRCGRWVSRQDWPSNSSYCSPCRADYQRAKYREAHPNFRRGSAVIDMVGQPVGEWIVIERGPNSKMGQARWWCRCSCGNVALVPGGDLRSGKSTSCGRGIHARNYKHGRAVGGHVDPDLRREISRRHYAKYRGSAKFYLRAVRNNITQRRKRAEQHLAKVNAEIAYLEGKVRGNV